MPSVRELARSLGAGVASRSRIHDAFTGSRLPAWGLLQVLVRALTHTVPDGEASKEEKHLHTLWLSAAGASRGEIRDQRGLEPRRTEGELAVLAMRVEWATPAGVEIGARRFLRQHVTSALQDTGYQGALLYRHDGSAGSTVAVSPTRERPSLTAATFLAAMDFEHQGRTQDLRFMAHLAQPESSYAGVELEAEKVVADLESFCSSPLLEPHWPRQSDIPTYMHGRREHPVSAIVHGIEVGRFGDFWGGWVPVELAFDSHSKPSRFWCREYSETPF